MRIKALLPALALAITPVASLATTVTSNTIDGICEARVVLYGSPAAGGQVVLYRGALAKGGINLQVYTNQGNRVCYSRGADPHNCQSPMTPEVCAAVTNSPGDTLDIR